MHGMQKMWHELRQLGMMARMATPAVAMALAGIPLAGSVAHAARLSDAERTQQLTGVYESIRDGKVLPGGLKNQGSPEDIALRDPQPVPKQDASGNPILDPFDLCQAVGPLRMMAQPRLKIELVPAPGRIVMLFQDLSHGDLRDLYLGRGHPADYQPKYAFQGDSVAHWDGGTLVVDTTGFNDRTWINRGALASDALHLVEKIRPIDGGKYLEYRVWANDPKVMKQPYTYVRYLKRTDREIEEDVCQIHSNWNPLD